MAKIVKESDLEVKTLGTCKIDSPSFGSDFHFVEDSEREYYLT